MFASLSVPWVFTVVFVLTGLYALGRFALLASGAERDGDRGVELSHVVMSVAMIAMAWGWTGGPATPSGVLQLVVFGIFAVSFLAQAVAAGHDVVASADHAVMNAAMVWMVAAMPALMGMPATAGGGGGGHAGHAGHGSGAAEMAGMDGMAAAPTPAWVTAMTGVLVVVLACSAVLWGVRAARAVSAVSEQPTAETGVVATQVSTASAVATNRRADACCHLLMSLGMGGMLFAML
ncbi:DUF5134 domain-containing protein [Pseudonocardia sp. ICBG601]|uniref:DUF5134 domain-containing protein n=1 Tax=Pseudonocardia sp. ICBG601 TaxID=2846759 RepID=UPI001CF6D386|nr:DUF5134 domain-containing protein [Pseudonocardia sp. ICBG601]